MEIEGEDGSRIQLKEGSEVVFGRGNGFSSKDPSVSRRHISFELKSRRVSFDVIGKNPIWVRSKESGEIKGFRRSERGELRVGDLFCVSVKDPVWFSLRKVEGNESEIGGNSCEEEREVGDGSELEVSSESGNGQDFDLGFESIDVSSIDPVKEFGFLVIGHEFDNFPNGMIRDVKKWNWFLEDRREESTDDEDDASRDKGKKALSRKRKKKSDRDEDDEEWTGESEQKEVLAKARRGNAPKYSTRSKNLGKGRPKNDSGNGKGSAEKRKRVDEEEDDDEDEEGDETLGGFIVGDEDDDVVEEEEVEDEDEDEEEEFEEDEYED